jgi:lipid-A-disaccharide synthase
MLIVLVAGEASGDQLGAALMRAIALKSPGARFAGIGGPLMKAEGCDCWWDTGELSLMGLFEVVSHLPRMLKLRKALVQRVLELKPDIYVGIDAPDFNLGVEKRLRARAIPVIHYVSPTVWAWRSGRVKTIAKSTDRVMCLFPFEPDFYKRHSVPAEYTGHPKADEIPLHVEKTPARVSFGIDPDKIFIALLPGSRMGEVEKLSAPMLDAAAILQGRYPDAIFLVPAATEIVGQAFKSVLGGYPGLDCRVIQGQSKEVMSAADVVICASGTATLEVMLINRPMVVCYRVSGMTYRLMKWFRMLKTRYFSLPNILAADLLVPELLQHEVTGQRIADEAARWLGQPALVSDLKMRFDHLHRVLRIDAAATAGDVVLKQIAHSKG